MANRQDLHDVVEELPASELGAALRYLRFLCYDGLAEQPVDAETVAGTILVTGIDNRGQACEN